jgi:hypothetical protein
MLFCTGGGIVNMNAILSQAIIHVVACQTEDTKPVMRTVRRYAIFLLTMSIFLLLTLLLTYGANWWGANTGDNRTFPLPPTSTLILVTPAANLAAVDPQVIGVIDGARGVVFSDRAVQPLGAFVPRSGNTQFTLPNPTGTPTLFPYPTSPPLPVTPLGAFVPTADLTLVGRGIMQYAGDGCAPTGMPLDGLLTQRFHSYHSGIDIGIPLGTPIFATHSGQVTFAGWSDVGYGYLIIVQNGRFITYYAHQTSFNVIEKQFVGRGSLIGWSGSTGNSSGPHLHYETRIDDVPTDPLKFETLGHVGC